MASPSRRCRPGCEAAQLDLATLQALRGDLLKRMVRPDVEGFSSAFAALTLSEVARTDRLQGVDVDEERDELVVPAAVYLARIRDYRAFSDAEGFLHAVAHGADLVLQLALNPADHESATRSMMLAVSRAGRARGPGVAYWAGEPDRLARADRVHRATKAAYRSGVAGVLRRGHQPQAAGILEGGVHVRSRYQEAS